MSPREAWVLALGLSGVIACGGESLGTDGTPCRAETFCTTHCMLPAEVASATLDGESPALVCGPARGSGSSGTACESGEECVHGLCTVAGTCVVPCEDQGAQEDRESCDDAECVEVFVRGEGSAIHPVEACVPRFVLPDSVRIAESAAESFAAQEDARWTLHLFEAAAEERAQVQELRAGDEVLFSPELIDTSPPPVPLVRLPVALPPTYVVAALPDGTTAETATWTLELDRELALRGSALSRDPASAPRTLDLDLFYVGLELTPTGDRGPASVAAAVDTLEAALAQVDLALGEVRQHAVGGVVGDELGIMALQSGLLADYDRLMALGRGTRGPGIPIFLVREMDFYLGVTGQIPGAQGRPGTIASGSVVCFECSSDFPRVFAHEVGHYLGLFHPTEITGIVLEPRADTPVCTSAQDLDADGYLTASECAEHGAANLMFYAPSGEELSADQGVVLQRALVLH